MIVEPNTTRLWHDAAVQDSDGAMAGSRLRSLRLIVDDTQMSQRSFMKAYVITSGTVFALVFAAHIWRATAEGVSLAKNPIFILTTTAALALVVWAWRVVRAMPRS